MMDHEKLIRNAIPQTMNLLTPPMDYFSEFVSREGHYNRFNLINCVNYHKAVAQFFAFQKAEAYGMLGFCYDRLGESAQAQAAYRQAISLNPEYFWPYYDLGVIHYSQAKYSQAEDYFTQALEHDPRKTLVLLSYSKVYNDVKASQQGGGYDYFNGIKQGRTGAFILLMDSLYKTGAFEPLFKVAVNGIKEEMDVQGIFYYYAGAGAFHLKSYQKAAEFLQIALQKDPRNSDALLYLGRCLQAADKPQMAQALFSKAAWLHEQGGQALEAYLKARVRFF